VKTITIFIIAVVGIVAILLVFGYYSNKKRVGAFTTWSAQNGWTYTEKDSKYEYMPWGFPFDQGHGRQATDVLTSTQGNYPALCFTYRYQTTSTTSNGSGGTTTTEESHYFAIFSLHLPKSFPTLRVGKEGVFSKLARMVGMHDVEFESEDFNRKFKVKADDRKFASDAINPQMMQYLLSEDAPGFNIVGSDLVLWQRGRLKLADVQPRMAYLQAVLTKLPNFLWQG